ncbi:hypothetical protein QQZ08_007390 [Neonectria magnoliae]|uniref:AT hook domain-containing protein n=1 Tax=Neonectria magnoliae TaxID=2732573 RepID=A0ABR1HZ56_9HYPO
MRQVVDLTGDTRPRRQTRSSTRLQQPQPPPPSSSSSQLPPPTFDALPWSLRGPPSQRRTLLRKRTWLQSHSVTLPADLRRRCPDADPAAATLVFAQDEAGTAVCISPDGVLLTCAHCVAETPADLDLAARHTLLFASGRLVAARTVAWDPAPFPHVRLADAAPKRGARLLCVGHPGSEDLEDPVPGLQTGYDTLVLSTGTFRGLAPGADPQDNSEIGALAHDCWTYWGHSGAGLVDRATGALVGVHSSWDDETGMRRGVPWEAVDAFVGDFERRQQGKETMPEGWRWCVR